MFFYIKPRQHLAQLKTFGTLAAHKYGKRFDMKRALIYFCIRLVESRHQC